MTGPMSRVVDGERLAVLRMLAGEVIAAECFPAFKLASNDDSEADIARNRALMALVAADEMGVPVIDALNRARFDERGLWFAASVFATPEVQVVQTSTLHTTPATPEIGTVKVTSGPGTAFAIPKGYMSPETLMADASIGELAVFIEEATKKDAHPQHRGAAWEVLADKLPTQTPLELGKLTRWIINKHHQPARREMFADVLVAAEARIEALGGAAT
jgi:hypothetical protein